MQENIFLNIKFNICLKRLLPVTDDMCNHNKNTNFLVNIIFYQLIHSVVKRFWLYNMFLFLCIQYFFSFIQNVIYFQLLCIFIFFYNLPLARKIQKKKTNSWQQNLFLPLKNTLNLFFISKRREQKYTNL